MVRGREMDRVFAPFLVVAYHLDTDSFDLFLEILRLLTSERQFQELLLGPELNEIVWRTVPGKTDKVLLIVQFVRWIFGLDGLK